MMDCEPLWFRQRPHSRVAGVLVASRTPAMCGRWDGAGRSRSGRARFTRARLSVRAPHPTVLIARSVPHILQPRRPHRARQWSPELGRTGRAVSAGPTASSGCASSPPLWRRGAPRMCTGRPGLSDPRPWGADHLAHPGEPWRI